MDCIEAYNNALICQHGIKEKKKLQAKKIIENSPVYHIIFTASIEGKMKVKVTGLDNDIINALKTLGYKVKIIKKRWYFPNREPHILISWGTWTPYCGVLER